MPVLTYELVPLKDSAAPEANALQEATRHSRPTAQASEPDPLMNVLAVIGISPQAQAVQPVNPATGAPWTTELLYFIKAARRIQEICRSAVQLPWEGAMAGLGAVVLVSDVALM